MTTDYALVMTTCADLANAELIATKLIGQRLAACVQIFPINSFYQWECALQNTRELMVFLKIKAIDYADAEAAIRAAHTYDNPEIIAVSIEQGAPAYLSWIASVTR